MPKLSSNNLKILRALFLLVTTGALVTFVVIGFARGWGGSMSGLQVSLLLAGIMGFSMFGFTIDALQKQSGLPKGFGAEDSNGNTASDTLASLIAALELETSATRKGALCRDIAILQHKLGDNVSAIESLKRCIDYSPGLASSIRKHRDLTGLIENTELSHLFKGKKGTGSPIRAFSAWIVLLISGYAVGSSIFFLGMFAYTEVVGYTGKLSVGGRLLGILIVATIGVLGALAARWGWRNKNTTRKLSVIDRQIHLKRAEALINWVVWLAFISAFCTIYNTWDFFTNGENLNLVSGLITSVMVFLLFVMIIGVIKKSRVAATIFTLYQIAGAIYYVPAGQPHPMYVFLSVFLSVFLVLGTVAIYLRHMLLDNSDVHEVA